MNIGSYYYAPVPIFQGGWVTGGEASSDGTIVGRCDTYNGVIRKPGETTFRVMLRPGVNVAVGELSMPRADLGGAFDVAVCYGNANYLAIVCHGRLFFSSNGGTTYTYKSAFGSVTQDPNGGGRQAHRKLAFDPADGTTLALGCEAGLRYSTNSGTSVTLHPNIPAPSGTAFQTVAVYFDRSSGTTSGRTNRVYCYSAGNGWYVSTTTITGTFSAISGSPLWCTMASVHPDNGYLYMAGHQSNPTSNGDGENEGQLRRWNLSTWTAPASATGVKAIVCVPGTSGNRVYTSGSGGGVQCSYDAASTLTFTSRSGQTQTRLAPADPWLAWCQETYMSNGDYCWDPLNSRVICFEGIGIWEWRTPNTSGTPSNIDWYNIGGNFGQLVGKDAMVTPDGLVALCGDDRPIFTFERTGHRDHPTKHGPTNEDQLSLTSNVDYSTNNANHLFAACGFTGNWKMAYTNDRGNSWTRVLNVPQPLKTSGAGGEGLWAGEVAVAQTGKVLYVPINQRPPYYNSDATNPASSWAVPNFGATANAYLIENSDVGGMHAAAYLARKIILVDKNTGKFYLYWVSDGDGGARDLACRGIWESPANDPSQFTRVKSTLIGSWVRDYWNSKITQCTSQAGHFWFTAGTVGNPGQAHDGQGMYFTTDYMRNWTSIGGSAPTEVQCLGFGKAAPGASYPSILAYSEDYGYYLCTDFNPASPNAATWTLLGYWMGADGDFDVVRGIAGDPGVYGRWYIALGGSGYRKITFENRIICN